MLLPKVKYYPTASEDPGEGQSHRLHFMTFLFRHGQKNLISLFFTITENQVLTPNLFFASIYFCSVYFGSGNVTVGLTSIFVRPLRILARPGGLPARPGGVPARPGGVPARPGGVPVRPGGVPVRPGGVPIRPNLKKYGKRIALFVACGSWILANHKSPLRSSFYLTTTFSVWVMLLPTRLIK